MIKLLFSICFSLCLTMLQAQQVWSITDDYKIAFNGTGAEGTFQGLKGTIVFDEAKLSSSYFKVSLDPSTISTGNNLKDEHARGDSWFDVNKYDIISFESTSIRLAGAYFLAKGNLRLHGTTKPIEIKFKFNEINSQLAEFIGTLTINREAFGIKGPMFSFMVGDDFDVDIQVKVKK